MLYTNAHICDVILKEMLQLYIYTIFTFAVITIQFFKHYLGDSWHLRIFASDLPFKTSYYILMIGFVRFETTSNSFYS